MDREAFENPNDVGYTLEGWAGRDDAPESPDLRYWLVRVSEELPGADPATVATLALHLLSASVAPWDDSSDNGSLANAVADLSDAKGLTRRQALADIKPGDIDAVRALHSWVKADQDGAPNAAPAPDAYEGSRHQVTRKRSRSGRTSTTVRRRGVAQVQGSWRPHWSPVIPRTTDITTAAIVAWWEATQATRSGLRYGRYGANVISVQRAARERYAGLIPSLLGTDVEAFGEVIEAGSGAVDTFGVTIRHDDIGGYASTTALRASMTGRERNQDGQYDHLATPWSKPTSSGLEWDPRVKLLAVKARKSEPVDHVHLIAPSLTPGHVFIGHRCVVRGILAKKRTGKDYRTVGTFKLRPGTDDAAVMLRDLAPGMRALVNSGVYSGSITVSGKVGKPRYSGRIADDEGHKIKVDGARSIPALLAKLPI